MVGAGKKRNKLQRQHNQPRDSGGNPNGGHTPAHDGPSEAQQSPTGPSQGSSSRGSPPSDRSNPLGQPWVQAPSIGSSSRPPDPQGAGDQPLRDRALETARLERLTLNTSGDIVPTVLMKRPGYGTRGRDVDLQLNSHKIVPSTNRVYHQYDIHVGNGMEKRGLIKIVWASKQLEQKLPGGRVAWIFDGNKLAWSASKLEQDLRLTIDLDAERGQPVQEGRTPDRVQVAIRRTKSGAKIDLNCVYEYLSGKCALGSHVNAAITFLDHVIQETPIQKHVKLGQSYFNRTFGGTQELGGGIEAMRGIYQSIRAAQGKRLVANVDVCHTAFWREDRFDSIVSQLNKNENAQSLQSAWRNQRGVFEVMTRLQTNYFHIRHEGKKIHGGRDKAWKVAEILRKSSRDFKFKPWNRERNDFEPEVSLFLYYQRAYNIRLDYPDLPVIKTTKTIIKRDANNKIVTEAPIVFPMELCTMLPNQRYLYKLTEGQTTAMLSFAVARPSVRLQGIDKSLDILAWDKDPYLRHHGIHISRERILTKARILPSPELELGGSVLRPGTGGKWNLQKGKFVAGNTASLVSWGVMIINPDPNAVNPCTLDEAHAFVHSLITSYRIHGGAVPTNMPVIQKQVGSDLRKAIDILFEAVDTKHNRKAQMLVFILPGTNANVYNQIKKRCDCHWGVYSQCVQRSKISGMISQEISQKMSNLLMKFNAKLGGTTNRITGTHFTKRTMIIGADVSHSPAGAHAPSYAAMTVSMDLTATRYAAGVETNGFREETISAQNLRKCLKPLVQHWMKTLNSGRLPDHVYYFRDGVSHNQYEDLLKTEVADLKKLFKECDTQKEVKLTVVVAEKRHHIRFFPQSGDKNGNPLPGTIVERDVTDPHDNDFYLCSHAAFIGTARPTHYTMLRDEIGATVDEFQRLLYEQCYQYIRSTTSVSLHPAVYYAHLASKRARAHSSDVEESSGSTSARSPEEVAPLSPIDPNNNGMRYGMWYI